MDQQSTLQMDTKALDERLAGKFYSSRRYNPIFLAVTGLGFIAVFLLTQFGVLGDPAPQLLYIGSITLLFAVAEIPILVLARRKNGVVATLVGSAIAGVFAILLTVFWQGIFPVAILIACITPLIALRSGLPGRFSATLLLVLAISLGGIFAVNANPPMERLQNNTSAAIASIVFLAAAGLLLVTITSISQNRRFRSIQGLLLTSFIVIVTVPIVMTAVLSALGSYTNSQDQTFNTLTAITTLKENQIENLLSDFRNDTQTLLADARFTTNTQEALNATVVVDPLVQASFKRQTRLRMVDVLGAEEEAYNEIMVLNTRGQVVISIIPEREGTSFDRQRFFQKGTSGFYAGFVEEPSFGNDNMIVAAPIFGEDGQTVIGVLALRSNAAAIKRIIETTPGFTEAETYLVDLNFKPVTRLRTPTASINSEAASEAILKNTKGGKSIYTNYAGQQVFGYYEWFEPMQLAIIAEVPTIFVLNNSVRALTGSFVLALFVLAIAVAAVAVSARTIADPIKTLAQTTTSFAAGELSSRAMVNRGDEIGALAQAYNQMATQLQETIGNLERRVADRTRDLESQTLRLRVAAEIARDSASARDLNELLARAADLILSRFDFYHIGIFLLDNNKQYAVLVASPTEAGRRMIENNHRLRVGEVGIVGRASVTGEPRIALDTGADPAFFNNPYLPDTRSEMALPLKVENNIIGVLDVQSDQPEAFNEDDVTIMQVMADQLATAIERTRLLQEVERNLRELESAYGQFTRDNWKRITEEAPTGSLGYRFDNVRLERITELPDLAGDVLTSGKIVNSNGQYAGTEKERSVAIPIKLRGQTIGVVSLKLKEGYDNSTVSIIESAADRLAAALESARLYEEARLRADREQSISRVTTAISASTGFEQILQTTVREIGNILGDTEVAIQILDEPGAVKRVTGQGEQ
jgi:GAF domain-containing protein/HAMP domain-containing protein